MGDAKRLRVQPISSSDARRIITDLHYSGKVVQNSQLHLGVFLDGRCGGAMSFGPPMDKSKLLGLVSGTPWSGMLELNRMAFAEWLPRNGESRALGYAFRWMRTTYPQIEWVVSFADGTQCGDGTIYRAAGFLLTGIHKSLNLVRLPSGAVIHKMTLESSPTRPRPELGGRSYYDITGGRYDLRAYAASAGGVVIPGFQLRYVRCIADDARQRLTVPVLPYSEIDRVGARMYRGQRPSAGERSRENAAAGPPAEGGVNPTRSLQPNEASHGR